MKKYIIALTLLLGSTVLCSCEHKGECYNEEMTEHDSTMKGLGFLGKSLDFHKLGDSMAQLYYVTGNDSCRVTANAYGDISERYLDSAKLYIK